MCGDDVRQCFCFVRCDHDDVVLLDYYINYVLARGVFIIDCNIFIIGQCSYLILIAGNYWFIIIICALVIDCNLQEKKTL